MKLPVDFMVSTRSLLGEDAELFFAALSGEPAVSIRLNPLKTARDPLKTGAALQRVPWSRWGYYLAERPAFTFDPLLHAGYYYVQDASSMFVEHVVKELVTEPATCLDLCAAPGGKSLSLLSALPPGSLLVSNEVVRQRAHVLSETITKFGHSHTVVTNNEARDFGALPRFFDLILVDAPCSGEGMFRKDSIAIEEWSLQNVKMCAVRQQEILNDIWPALKPGGLLIYSTCTYNRAENEDIIWQFARSASADFVEVETNPEWGVSPSFDNRVKGYRFFPHRVKGEGLSLFIVRKTGQAEVSSNATSNTTLSTLPNTSPNTKTRLTREKKYAKSEVFSWDTSPYQPYFRDPARFRFVKKENRVVALPVTHAETMLALDGRLKNARTGVEVGEIKGKNFIPSHALALSTELNRRAFCNFALTYEQAIAYLRREALVLPADLPKGVVLLTYENESLGFVKNVGNRANNLYPNEWRIRGSHLPEIPPRLFSSILH